MKRRETSHICNKYPDREISSQSSMDICSYFAMLLEHLNGQRLHVIAVSNKSSTFVNDD